MNRSSLVSCVACVCVLPLFFCANLGTDNMDYSHSDVTSNANHGLIIAKEKKRTQKLINFLN